MPDLVLSTEMREIFSFKGKRFNFIRKLSIAYEINAAKGNNKRNELKKRNI